MAHLVSDSRKAAFSAHRSKIADWFRKPANLLELCSIFAKERQKFSNYEKTAFWTSVIHAIVGRTDDVTMEDVGRLSEEDMKILINELHGKFFRGWNKETEALMAKHRTGTYLPTGISRIHAYMREPTFGPDGKRDQPSRIDRNREKLNTLDTQIRVASDPQTEQYQHAIAKLEQNPSDIPAEKRLINHVMAVREKRDRLEAAIQQSDNFAQMLDVNDHGSYWQPDKDSKSTGFASVAKMTDDLALEIVGDAGLNDLLGELDI